MSPTLRTVVLGALGQVGSSLMQRLGATGVGITRKDADITNRDALYRALDSAGPASALINAAAYTDVESAERERELAFAVNAHAPGWAAAWAAEHGIPFVHFSTEYVFSDGGELFWQEGDVTAPLNAYGESKRAGEVAVHDAYQEGVIIRTSWVYSEQSGNFVRKVLDLAKSRESLTVVGDQVGRPTFAADLAGPALRIAHDSQLRSRIVGGVLHLASGEPVSKFDFARAIVDVGVAEGVLSRAVPIVEITTEQLASTVRRPLRCVLDTSLAKALGLEMPPWSDSLTIAVRAARP